MLLYMFAYLTLLDSIVIIIFRNDNKLRNLTLCDFRVLRCSVMRVGRRCKIHTLRPEDALVGNNSTMA